MKLFDGVKERKRECQLRRWHPHFTIRPVLCEDSDDVVCLETVWRKMKFRIDGKPVYTYLTKDAYNQRLVKEEEARIAESAEECTAEPGPEPPSAGYIHVLSDGTIQAPVGWPARGTYHLYKTPPSGEAGHTEADKASALAREYAAEKFAKLSATVMPNEIPVEEKW